METLDINYIIRKDREYFKQEIKLTKKKMETLDINYIIKKERENEQGIINLTKKE